MTSEQSFHLLERSWTSISRRTIEVLSALWLIAPSKKQKKLKSIPTLNLELQGLRFMDRPSELTLPNLAKMLDRGPLGQNEQEETPVEMKTQKSPKSLSLLSPHRLAPIDLGHRWWLESHFLTLWWDYRFLHQEERIFRLCFCDLRVSLRGYQGQGVGYI